MKRISFGVYQSVIAVAYLGLMTNALLVITCLPLLLLAMTTDPARSWPFFALAAPFCAPAIAAAFSVFRAHGEGGMEVIRPFFTGYRATFKRALGLGCLITATLVVFLVDVRFFSDSPAGVVVIPLLAVLIVLVLAVALVGLTAVAEVPVARTRTVIRTSAYFALSRWYLTAASLIVLAAYCWLFVSMPAIALGFATAPALYLAWANSRHSLRSVIELAPIDASTSNS